MNCGAAERQIFADRDGALDNNQRAVLATHLASCAACRALSDRLAAAVKDWNAAANNVTVPDSNIEWQKVRRAIRAQPEKRWKATWIAVPLVGAAAAVAIGVYVGTDTPPSAAPKLNAAAVGAAPAVAAAASPQPSTVIYVDEKSGWTFVVAADDASGQHI